MATHSLKGLVKGVSYDPYLNEKKLTEYNMSQFDVNKASVCGLINLAGISHN